MPDEHPLTLRQADQGRANFAAIGSERSGFHQEPTRASRGAKAVGSLLVAVMLGTACIVQTLAFLFR
jgi:hypothetical protein